MSERISPLGSTALRWRYSTLSAPGAELDRERSFLVISAGVGLAVRLSSVGPVGTHSSSFCLMSSGLQSLLSKTLVKKAFASSAVPVKEGELLLRICRAARFLEIL